MAGYITYTVSEGILPITVTLTDNADVVIVQNLIELPTVLPQTYTITDLPCEEYKLYFVDSSGCDPNIVLVYPSIDDVCCATTTTTTIP